MESGGYLKVTVTATKKFGTIIADLYKGTGVTEPYEGKSFSLYDSSGNYRSSATTNSSGYAYFYGVPYGGYTVRAGMAPANLYYEPTSVNVNLTGDSATARFTLYRSTGTLKINYSTEDGQSLGSVRFRVTDPGGTARDYYTDSGGHITIDPAVTGSCSIEQVSAPNGYECLSGKVTATVSRAATTTVAIYNPILYDFAVSLTAPSKVEQMQPLTSTVVFRNNSVKNASGVPIRVTFAGSTVYSDTITIPGYGSVTKTLTFDTSTIGTKTLWAGINTEGVKQETNTADNTASRTVTVTTSTNLRISFVEPNSDYREGVEVISTFRVANDGYNHITPDSNLSVQLAVSYTQDGVTKTFSVPTRKQVVVPYGGDNLVYFRWMVPVGTAGLPLTITATDTPDGRVGEKNRSDDSVTFARTVAAYPNSVTPETKYEASAPAGFHVVEPPARSSAFASLSWSEWVWANGWFQKVSYGLQFDASSAPSIVPDALSPSRSYSNGVWTMRSGYGFTCNWSVLLKAAAGMAMPGLSAYTSPQSAGLYVPEYAFGGNNGEYRTLERISTSTFQLPVDTNTLDNGRLHFTPLYFPDGDYICQGCVYDIWTPAGMLCGWANSNAIRISGSIYDDWTIIRK